jgi:hypothetical protein
MRKPRTRPKSILRLKVKGPHIKPGRIPIPELLVICEQAQTAVNRQAEVLRGKRGLRPGPTATLVRDECTLELFSIGRGSAVMRFARSEPKPDPQAMLDIDIEKLGEAAVREVGVALRSAKKKAPVVMDIGVRRAFQEMGKLLSNGVTRVEWSVPGVAGQRPSLTAVLDDAVRARIDETAAGTSIKPVNIDGRLEMADFKLGDLKCIIHTPDGQRVTCSFASDIEDDVYQALRHIARVTGTATINPKTMRTDHIILSSVKRLDPFLGHAEDFFTPLNLEQLTRAQRVDPAFDLRTLTNVWPEDENVDAFLAAIENAR